VSKKAGLWEAVHPFTNFNKDVAVVDEWGKLILVHDVLGYIFKKGDAHVSDSP
jgi:hypothetical protein